MVSWKDYLSCKLPEEAVNSQIQKMKGNLEVVLHLVLISGDNYFQILTLQLLSRASFFVHGLPRSHIPLTGQAPKRAENT
jgi:hypothetical protein